MGIERGDLLGRECIPVGHGRDAGLDDRFHVERGDRCGAIDDAALELVTDPGAHDDGRGDELVRLATQRLQMTARVVDVGRLVEPDAVAFEHLIRADDESVGMPP